LRLEIPKLSSSRPLALALLLSLVGCVGPSAGSEPLPLGSRSTFVAAVQPVLELRCASGGCHGLEERPLSFFAPGMNRLDAEMLHMDRPMLERELLSNAEALAAFALEPDPRDSLALCKPLGMESGGCYHGGGEIFSDETDPGYRAILAWLREAETEVGGWR